MKEKEFDWDKDWSVWLYTDKEDESPTVTKHDNKRDALRSYLLYTRKNDNTLRVVVRKGKEDMTSTVENFISNL